MSRGLLVFALVVLPLAALGVMCTPLGSGASDNPQGAAAQATNVRRTAVAEVQRIIASNPTSTPQPSPTATPVPTCREAIWWTEARSHVGEFRSIQGTVVATRPAPGGAAMLEIGQLYPDPTGLAVLVPASAAAEMSGKTLCVRGRISLAEGRLAVQVSNPNTIVVLD